MSGRPAVIFDLDGTLIDSAPDINAIANAVLAQDGHDPITLAETRSFVGNGAGVFVARMMAARAIPPDPATHARMLAEFTARYETAVDLTRLYPGARAALDALAAAGHPLGLCTNKPLAPTRVILGHFGLAKTFAAVVGGDSLEVRKPDPAPLAHCLAETGAGACLYVGDSEVDAETARRAGLPFALFTRGYRKSPVAEIPHDRAFDHFDALPALVADLI